MCPRYPANTLRVNKIAMKGFSKHLAFGVNFKLQVPSLIGALASIMSNIGEPGPFKRRIISRVVTSVILYVSKIWSEALPVGMIRMILSSVYCLSTVRQK